MKVLKKKSFLGRVMLFAYPGNFLTNRKELKYGLLFLPVIFLFFIPIRSVMFLYKGFEQKEENFNVEGWCFINFWLSFWLINLFSLILQMTIYSSFTELTYIEEITEAYPVMYVVCLGFIALRIIYNFCVSIIHNNGNKNKKNDDNEEIKWE